ncbi:MAG TPA: hypothetical protein VF223_12075 [Trebonia sp.]
MFRAYLALPIVILAGQRLYQEVPGGDTARQCRGPGGRAKAVAATLAPVAAKTRAHPRTRHPGLTIERLGFAA